MNPCPSCIAEPLLEILTSGLLSIRVLGWNGNAEACASHADHLHNIPSLINHYSDARLLYYWHTERPIFIQELGGCIGSDVTSAWSRLKPIIAELESKLEQTQEVAVAR